MGAGGAGPAALAAGCRSSERPFHHCLEARLAQCAFLLHMPPDRIALVVAHAQPQPLAVSGGAQVRIATELQVDRMQGHQRVMAAAQMGVDARPAMLLRCGNHRRAYGVELDVTQHAQQVRVRVHQAGLVAALPEPAAAPVACVECLGMTLADAAHGAADGACCTRAHEHVDVIVHQHISVYGDAVALAGLPQEPAVVQPVGIVQEDRAPVHPALGDVHRDAGQLETGEPGHVVPVCLCAPAGCL